MDKTTKTLLIVLGSLFLVCVCAAGVLFSTGMWSIGKIANWAQSNTSEDPAKVEQIASEIANFDIPDGFNKHYGMKLANLTMVQYTSDNEKVVIIVTQFPAGVSINPDEMMRDIKNGSRDPNSPWYNVDTELIEQRPVTIRGQETTLSISEGTDKDGTLYRVGNAKFQGNGMGSAIVLIAGPKDQWDVELMEDFIASID
jgi:predicted GH43/DUF377 family glycosyl hydrolase